MNGARLRSSNPEELRLGKPAPVRGSGGDASATRSRSAGSRKAPASAANRFLVLELTSLSPKATGFVTPDYDRPAPMDHRSVNSQVVSL